MVNVRNHTWFFRLALITAFAAHLGMAQALADDGNYVPFVAALSGTAQWDGGPIATCQGAGVALHMGKTSSQCTAELDFSGYGEYEVCSGVGETGLGIPNVNTIVLTGANGDQLVIVSRDIACEIIPFRSFHGVGEWTVDASASTGRFAGASGTGLLEGTVDFVEGDVQVSVIGEIDY
jgi:hypothetical protein